MDEITSAEFDRLRRRVQRLESLVEATSVLNSTLDFDELLALIMQLATSQMNADRSSLFLLDASKRNLVSKVAQGLESKEIVVTVGAGIAGAVAETGEDIIIDEACSDPRFNPAVDHASGYRTRTILCVPVRNNAGEIAGVMQVLNKKEGFFDREDAEYLKALSTQAAIVLEKSLLHRSELERQRMARELSLAREIQSSLLPSRAPRVAAFDLASVYRACFEVGGDYYGYFPFSDSQIGLAIADVSGKGMPAAMHSTALRSMLQLLASPSEEITELVSRLNENVFKNTNARSFITFFYALLDSAALTVDYVNAGHNRPLIVDPASGGVRELDAGGLPLGVLPHGGYDRGTAQLSRGEILCLFTDGLSEAFGAGGEQYGTERLVRVIREHHDAPAERLCDFIIKDVEQFVGIHSPAQLCPFHDDLTLVVAKAL